MALPIDLRRIEELGLNASAAPGQLWYQGCLLRRLPGQAKAAEVLSRPLRLTPFH